MKNFDGILDLIDSRLLKIPKNSLRDELGDVESLASSIRAEGLLQPLLVRPLGNSFEIVAGCRRFKALKTVGWKKIPCIIADLDDEEAYTMSLTENLQRETLNPIEEAAAFKKYVEEFGWGSETVLAEKISKSQEYVSQRLKLLRLPSDVVDLLRESRLRPSIARELSTIPDSRRQSSLAKRAADNGLTVTSVKALVESQLDDMHACPAIDEAMDESRRQQCISRKAILTLRVALTKIDSLVEEAQSVEEQGTVYGLLLAKRQELHRMLDDVIKWRVAKSKELGRHRAAYG